MVWPTARLGDVLKPVVREERVDASKEYRLLGIRLEGQGPFLRETVTGTQTSAAKLFRVAKGDFIYSRLFACRGAFGVISDAMDGCHVSSEFPTFAPVPGKVDVAFLKYWFRLPAVIARVDADCTGSTPLTRNRFKENFFLALDLQLPPLDEQRRVVVLIEKLVAQIYEARSLRRQAVEEVVALSYAALREMRHRLLNSAHSKSQLGVLTTVTSGGTPSRDNPAFWNGDIPWIKTGELIDGDIAGAEECITQSAVENCSAKLFPPNTVLIALYGQGQTRGRTGRLLISATTNQACCAILPRPEKFEPRFIQYWLRSLYLELREQSHGGAQPNWNGAMIKALTVALPPLPEQRKIVAEMDTLQAEVAALKRLQAETATELDALLPAILDRAFKGKL